MSLETKDVVAAVKKRPLLVACVLAFVVLVLALYFRMDVYDGIQARLNERDKELLRLTDNMKFSAQLDAQLQAIRKANAVIEAGALRANELARNQQIFYRLEAESGVKLLDLRQLNVASPPAKGGPATYIPIPVSLTIKGDYSQVLDFLQRLDHGATLCRVTTASISRPVEGDYTLSLGVELLGFRS